MIMQTDPISLSRSGMQHMLDLTYELEGLLQLALSREDDAPARLVELMDVKLKAITSIIGAPVAPELQPVASVEPASDNEPTPAADSYPADEDCSYAIPDDEDEEPSDVGQEPSAAPAIDAGACDDSDAAADAGVGEAIACGAAADAAEKVQSPSAAGRESISEAPAAPSAQAVPSAPRQASPVFSINDRFLFSRELFGGKVADFEAALKDVAGMDSYEEAEEYFYTEWKFDPESPTVGEFFAVITRFFER